MKKWEKLRPPRLMLASVLDSATQIEDNYNTKDQRVKN